MKKTLLVSAIGLLSFNSMAQLGDLTDKALIETAKKDKEASDKAILDEKKKAKPQTWIDRAKLYDQIAQRYTKLDSNAAIEAITSLKKAIELDAAKPGSATKEAKKYLSGGGVEEGVNIKGSLIKTGAEKFQNKKYVDAIKLFKMAQEIDAKDTLAQMYAGYAGMQDKNYPVAMEELEKYIANGGKDAGNYALLAQLYRQEKMSDKALAVLDRGMTNLPANKNSFKAERVNVLLDMGKTEEALGGLKELTKLDPTNSQYALNMGILQDNLMNNLSVDIRKLSDMSRKAGNLETKLKNAEETSKVYMDELKRISEGIKKQPKNADLKRQKADIENRIKESAAVIAEAKAEITKHKEEVAKAGDINAKIADLANQKEIRRAQVLESYGLALKADPNNYDALFNTAVLHYNEAVEIKSQTDAMSLQEYQAKGKDIESKACGKFKQAQPFFNRAKSLREDDDALKNSMKALEDILKQYEEKKTPCVESK